MDAPIAEDLLLLLHDETRGRFRANGLHGPTLAGAVLVDLALRGVVTMEVPGRIWRVTDAERTGDAVLDRALEIISSHPATAGELLAPIGDGLEAAILQRLVDTGRLERHDRRILGRRLFTTWTIPDKTHRNVVREHVVQAILADEDPQVRTGSLVALLDPLGDVVRQLDRRVASPHELERRARAHAVGGWREGAVREALRASREAVREIWAARSGSQGV